MTGKFNFRISGPTLVLSYRRSIIEGMGRKGERERMRDRQKERENEGKRERTRDRETDRKRERMKERKTDRQQRERVNT